MAKGRCKRCEELPTQTLDPNHILYINHPAPHTLGKIKKLIQDYDIDCSNVKEHMLSSHLPAEQTDSIARHILQSLSQVELSDAIAVVKQDNETLSIDSLAQSQPLANLLSQLASDWLIDILKENRLTTYFQPIVQSGDQQIYGYECLLRAYDIANRLVSPASLFATAQSSELLFYLDREARMKAIRQAQQHGINHNLFINFNPNSIYDPVNCLRTTCAEASNAEIPYHTIVFEVIESERVDDFNHLKYIVDYYREQGFRIALDDVGAGFNSLNLLSHLKPDIIKLDMYLIRDIDQDVFKQTLVNKLLNMAHELDIMSLAEGVETEQEKAWLEQTKVDLMQGFYFGKPQPEPIESH